jgi:hypothetical protein
MMSMASMVMSVSWLAGACAPRTKPLGYVGGSVLTVVGAGIFMSAGGSGGGTGSRDPIADGIGDIAGDIAAVTFGSAAVLTGLVILAGTALSPSGPELPPPPAPRPPAEPVTASSVGPTAPPPPLRTSTAPSGSPLAFP